MRVRRVTTLNAYYFFSGNSGYRASFLPVAGNYLLTQDAIFDGFYCLSTVESSCELIEHKPGARIKP